MASLQDDGTVLSRLKPIVTVLTEALIKDFAHVYTPHDPGMWVKQTPHGPVMANDAMFQADVRDWLYNLQGDYGGQEAASRIISMVRRNPGWVGLLAGRVSRVLRAE